MWEARALGYELVNNTLAPRLRKSSALEEYDDIGAQQREHYASRWEL
jgi:hypothetical protein